jgi:hypothetical protein
MLSNSPREGSDSGLRYSLRSLFWLVVAVAAPLGLSSAWTAVSTLLICSIAAVALWFITRQRIIGIALLTYLIALPVVFGVTAVGVNDRNPYVRAYNEHLEKLAVDANLVGDNEERVQSVLGSATSTYEGWNITDMETGQPTPEAEYITTYNYAPYWFCPLAKFQVHCRRGVVHSIELYDD